jgi:hypothetical protein
MPRNVRNRGFRTNAPREVTLVVAVFLWVVGFADVVLGVFKLPNNFGVWSLVLAGLLLIIASLVEGL